MRGGLIVWIEAFRVAAAIGAEKAGSSAERHRPGRPQPSFGCGGQRRTARLQLLFVDNRDSGNMSEFQHVVGLLRAPGQPCSRFSVALPLGINGQESFRRNRLGT
ncbi:phage DNA packaging protein J [uncultured Rikenella sp.]|uniref:phage DNA packaging protein J n=1 Tax=uncultured Rikenella sp. TaxID=368003 RepID=UPI00345C96B1